MTKEVNAGPVPQCFGEPDCDILFFRDGKCSLGEAFWWDESAQGQDYWRGLRLNNSNEPAMYTDLPDEAKAIIDAWCEELEEQNNE